TVASTRGDSTPGRALARRLIRPALSPTTARSIRTCTAQSRSARDGIRGHKRLGCDCRLEMRETKAADHSLPSFLSLALSSESGLGRGGDGAELTHQTEIVVVPPVLDDLAVRNAHDVEAAHLDTTPCRWDAKEVASVGAAHSRASDDLVP